jgi:type I restriction enzyme M protein
MKDKKIKELERRLWDGANHLRANSTLTAQQYSMPVLGLIFLRFAESRFLELHEKLQKAVKGSRREGQPIEHARYKADGVIYLAKKAQYRYILNQPEGSDIGKLLNEAMKLIEKDNPELAGALPRTYTQIENSVLFELLKSFNIDFDAGDGDIFGKIYEYFLGKFAMSEGKLGGEFFTPSSIVRLIVEVLEPFNGRVYDPACGSGGMFVQSAEFTKQMQKEKGGINSTTYFGQEKTENTMRLCKMNLAVHGLEGDIKCDNSYYNCLHKDMYGTFDYVMANPPFNVSNIDKERIKDDPRFEHGIPRADNGNYLWIQMFANALSAKGRAGFVMANSASDARQSEGDIRKKMIESGVVDVMVAVSSNFFYTVTLPVTLWFLDKGKKGSARENKVLFIDARNIFRQLDRAHRDWTDEHLQQISGIVRSYREEEGYPEYEDVKGLSKVATIAEIAEQDYSLNPGRYVGVTDQVADEDYDFNTHISELKMELDELTMAANDLATEIDSNLNDILNA